MRRIPVLGAFGLLLAGPAAAQPEAPPPALLVPLAPDAPSTPLGLRHLKVEATVSGFLARTRVTMTFHNPHPRPLEGELVFPLPAGCMVSGYALELDGVLVDGVVVEKEQARIAFE